MLLACGPRWFRTWLPRRLLWEKAFGDGQQCVGGRELSRRRVGWLDPARNLDSFLIPAARLARRRLRPGMLATSHRFTPSIDFCEPLLHVLSPIQRASARLDRLGSLAALTPIAQCVH
jgi:hypothetical protein